MHIVSFMYVATLQDVGLFADLCVQFTLCCRSVALADVSGWYAVIVLHLWNTAKYEMNYIFPLALGE